MPLAIHRVDHEVDELTVLKGVSWLAAIRHDGELLHALTHDAAAFLVPRDDLVPWVARLREIEIYLSVATLPPQVRYRRTTKSLLYHPRIIILTFRPMETLLSRSHA